MVDLAPGVMIAGRYRLERLLGEGGMGAVWAAVNASTGEQVALKFMKGLAAVSPMAHKRFYREARAAMAVRHPNVVRIHEVVRGDDGAPVMVMDLLVGESLHGRLAREGALPVPTFAKIFLPVVSAVGTAHSIGIVHRDLKPDNIFLQKTAGGEVEVRVLDFGIAKLTANEGDAAQTAGLTATGSLMGTPYYMAPEQVFGEKDLDHRADIWALGVIMYEGLAGKRPIDGDNVGQLFKKITTGDIVPLAQVAPHLPSDVTELAARMLQVDRTKRPEDLREVQAVLQRHSSLQTLDFGAATLPAQLADFPSDFPDPMEPTIPAIAPTLAATELATGSPLSRSQAAEAPARPRSRLPIMVIGALSAVSVVGIVSVIAMRSSSGPAPAASSTPAELPPAPSQSVLTTPTLPTAVSPSSTPSGATQEAHAAPSASASTALASTNSITKTAPKPKPTTSTSAPPPIAAPAPTPAKSSGAGGIGTATPF